ncbi:MAG: hypothetical protein WC222_04000 [Parachlamydiales bacterium]|jgi:hypothetical protein
MSSPRFQNPVSLSAIEALPTPLRIEELPDTPEPEQVFIVCGETEEDELRAFARNSGCVDEEYWLIGPVKKFDQDILDIAYITQALQKKLLTPIKKGSGTTTNAEIWESQYLNAEARATPITEFAVAGSTVIELLGPDNRVLILKDGGAQALCVPKILEQLDLKPSDFDGRSISSTEQWDEKVRLVVDAIYIHETPEERRSLYAMNYALLKKKIKEDFKLDVRGKGSDYTHIAFEGVDQVNKDKRGQFCLFSYSNIQIRVVGSSVTKAADKLQIKIICEGGAHPAQALIHKSLKITHTKSPEEKDYRGALVYSSNLVQESICPNATVFSKHLKVFQSFWKTCLWNMPYPAETVIYLIGNISSSHNSSPLFAKVGMLLKLESESPEELTEPFLQVWKKTFIKSKEHLYGIAKDICLGRIDSEVSAVHLKAVLGVLGVLHLGMPCHQKTGAGANVVYTEVEKKPTVRYLLCNNTYLHIPLELEKSIQTIEALYIKCKQDNDLSKFNALSQLFIGHFDAENYSGRGKSSLSKYAPLKPEEFALLRTQLETFLSSENLFLCQIAFAITAVFALHENTSAGKFFIEKAFPWLSKDTFIRCLMEKLLCMNALPAWEKEVEAFCKNAKWGSALAAADNSEFHSKAISFASEDEIEEVFNILVQTAPEEAVRFLKLTSKDPEKTELVKKLVSLSIEKLPLTTASTDFPFFSSYLDDLQLLSFVDQKPELLHEVFSHRKSYTIGLPVLLKLAKNALLVPSIDKLAVINSFDIALLKDEKLWAAYCSELLHPIIFELLSSNIPQKIQEGKKLKKSISEGNSPPLEVEKTLIDFRLFCIENYLTAGDLISAIKGLSKLAGILMNPTSSACYERYLKEAIVQTLHSENVFLQRVLLTLIVELDGKIKEKAIDWVWDSLDKTFFKETKVKTWSSDHIAQAHFCAEIAVLWLRNHPEIPDPVINYTFVKIQTICEAFGKAPQFKSELCANFLQAFLTHTQLENKPLKLHLDVPKKEIVLKVLLKNHWDIAASLLIKLTPLKDFSPVISQLAFKLARRWANLPKASVYLLYALQWISAENAPAQLGMNCWLKCATRWLNAAHKNKVSKEHCERVVLSILKGVAASANKEEKQIGLATSVIVGENLKHIREVNLKKLSPNHFVPFAAALKNQLINGRRRKAFFSYLKCVHMLKGNIFSFPANLKQLNVDLERSPYSFMVVDSFEKALEECHKPLQLNEVAEKAPDYLKSSSNVEFLLEVFYFSWHRKHFSQAFLFLDLVIALSIAPGFAASNKFKQDLFEVIGLFDSSQYSHTIRLLTLLKSWFNHPHLELIIQENFDAALNAGKVGEIQALFELKSDSQNFKKWVDHCLENFTKENFDLLSKQMPAFAEHVSLQHWTKLWCKLIERKKIQGFVEGFITFSKKFPLDLNEDKILAAYAPALEYIFFQSKDNFEKFLQIHPEAIELSFNESLSKNLRLILIEHAFRNPTDFNLYLTRLWNLYVIIQTNKTTIINYIEDLFHPALELGSQDFSNSLFATLCSHLNDDNVGPLPHKCAQLLSSINKWPENFQSSLYRLLQALNRFVIADSTYQLPALRWLLRFEQSEMLSQETFLILHRCVPIWESLSLIIRDEQTKVLALINHCTKKAENFVPLIQILNRCFKEGLLPNENAQSLIFDLLQSASENSTYTFEEKITALSCSSNALLHHPELADCYVRRGLGWLVNVCELKQPSASFCTLYALLYTSFENSLWEHILFEEVLEKLYEKLNLPENSDDDRDKSIECIQEVFCFHLARISSISASDNSWLKHAIEIYIIKLVKLHEKFSLRNISSFINSLSGFKLYSPDELKKALSAFHLVFDRFAWNKNKLETIEEDPVDQGINYLADVICLRYTTEAPIFFDTLFHGVYILDLYGKNPDKLCSFYKKIISSFHSLELLSSFIEHLTPQGHVFGKGFTEFSCLRALDVHLNVFEKFSDHVNSVQEIDAKGILSLFTTLAGYFTKILSLKLSITHPEIDTSILWKNYLAITKHFLDVLSALIKRDTDSTLRSKVSYEISELCIMPVLRTISNSNGIEESKEQLRNVFVSLYEMGLYSILEMEISTILSPQSHLSCRPFFESPLSALFYLPQSMPVHIAKAVLTFQDQASAITQALKRNEPLCGPELPFEQTLKFVNYLFTLALERDSLDDTSARAVIHYVQILLTRLDAEHQLRLIKEIFPFIYENKNHLFIAYSEQLLLEILSLCLGLNSPQNTIQELLGIILINLEIKNTDRMRQLESLLVRALIHIYSGEKELSPHKSLPLVITSFLDAHWDLEEFSQNLLLLYLIPLLDREEQQRQCQQGLSSAIAVRDPFNGMLLIARFAEMDVILPEDHVTAIFEILIYQFWAKNVSSDLFTQVLRDIFNSIEVEHHRKILNCIPVDICRHYYYALKGLSNENNAIRDLLAKFEEYIILKELTGIKALRKTCTNPSNDVALEYLDILIECTDFVAESTSSTVELLAGSLLREFITWNFEPRTLDNILNWFCADSPNFVLELFDEDSLNILVKLIKQRIAKLHHDNEMDIDDFITVINEKWQTPQSFLFIGDSALVSSLSVIAQELIVHGFVKEAFSICRDLIEAFDELSPVLMNNLLFNLSAKAVEIYSTPDRGLEFLTIIAFVEDFHPQNLREIIDFLWSRASISTDCSNACMMGIAFQSDEVFRNQFPAQEYVKRFILEYSQNEDMLCDAAELIELYEISDEKIWLQLFGFGALAKKKSNIEALRSLILFAENSSHISLPPYTYADCLIALLFASSEAKYPLKWSCTYLEYATKFCKLDIDISRKQHLLVYLLYNSTFAVETPSNNLVQFFAVRNSIHELKLHGGAGDLATVDKFLMRQALSPGHNQEVLTSAFSFLNLKQMEGENADNIINWYILLIIRLKEVLKEEEQLSPALSTAYRFLVGYLKRHMSLSKAISLAHQFAKLLRADFNDDVVIFVTHAAQCGATKETFTPDIRQQFFEMMWSAVRFCNISFMGIMNIAFKNGLIIEENLLLLQHECLRLNVLSNKLPDWERGLILVDRLDKFTPFYFSVAKTLIHFIAKNLLKTQDRKQCKRMLERVLTAFEEKFKFLNFDCPLPFPELIEGVCWNRSRTFSINLLFLNELLHLNVQNYNERKFILGEIHAQVEGMIKIPLEDAATGKMLTALINSPIAHEESLFEEHLNWFYKTVLCDGLMRNYLSEDVRYWLTMLSIQNKLPYRYTVFSLEDYKKVTHFLTHPAKLCLVKYYLKLTAKLIKTTKILEDDVRLYFITPLLQTAVNWQGLTSITANCLKQVMKLIVRKIKSEPASPETIKVIREYMELLFMYSQKPAYIGHLKNNKFALPKFIVNLLSNPHVFDSYQMELKTYYSHMDVFMPFIMEMLNSTTESKDQPIVVYYLSEFTMSIIKETCVFDAVQRKIRAEMLKTWLIKIAQTSQGKSFARDCFAVSKVFSCFKGEFGMIQEIFQALE